MGKHSKDEPKELGDQAIVHQFVIYGKTKAKTEKRANKIIDYLFDKYGRDIGVMSGQFVPAEVMENWENAAERALKRLEETRGTHPFGRNRSFTHGYYAAIRHAERVVREELTKHHGL